MKKLIMFLSVLGIFNFYGIQSAVFAQEQTATETAEDVSAEESAETTTDWESEIGSDKEQIKTQLDSMKEAGKTAREEAKALVEQIQEAAKAGDTDTVKSLQEQLKTTRQENIKERKRGRRTIERISKKNCVLTLAGRERAQVYLPYQPTKRKMLLIGARILVIGERMWRYREDAWDATHNPPPGTEAYRETS